MARRVVLAVWLASSLAVCATAQVGTKLDDLARTYSEWRTVQLISHATIRIQSSLGASAKGNVHFGYVASGEDYSLRCTTDPRLALGSDMTIAWDGRIWQMYDLEANMLHVRRAPPTTLPIACPNPIFLLLNFLQQDNDDCHDCDLTLPQVSARDRWETLTATGRALRDGSTQYEITNRLAPARAYVLKTRQTSSGETPVELTRFYPNGRVAFHITTTGGIRRRARSEEGAPQLNVQVFDEDAGTLALSGSWVIDTLRINEPVGGTAFELDAEHARSVWDSDLNMFIKHPDDRSLGRVLSPPH